MDSDGGRRRQFVLRVYIDDIHHIDSSLRSAFHQIESLRLAVVFEENICSPYITAEALDCGELDFNKLIFIFGKEQFKYLFFNLYIAQPPGNLPTILATGKLGMTEVTSENSVWTIPLSNNGRNICELTFCINQLPLLEQNPEEEYYPPSFTSAVEEVALGIRKLTSPTSSLCQTVAKELFLSPVRAGKIITRLFCKIFHKILSS